MHQYLMYLLSDIANAHNEEQPYKPTTSIKTFEEEMEAIERLRKGGKSRASKCDKIRSIFSGIALLTSTVEVARKDELSCSASSMSFNCAPLN